MWLPILYNTNRWAIGIVDRDGRTRLQQAGLFARRTKAEIDGAFLATKDTNVLVPVASALRGRSWAEFHGVSVADSVEISDAILGRARPHILPRPCAPVATFRPWEDVYHATHNVADPDLVAMFVCDKNPHCSQVDCIGHATGVIAFSGCGKGHNICMSCLIRYIRTCISTLERCQTQAWFTDLSVRLDADGYVLHCPGTRGTDCSSVMSVDAYHKIFKDAASDLGMQAADRLRVLMSELSARINDHY